MLFKKFLISVGPTVQWTGTIYAILEEGIMGNIYVKLFKFDLVVLEIMFKEKV